MAQCFRQISNLITQALLRTRSQFLCQGASCGPLSGSRSHVTSHIIAGPVFAPLINGAAFRKQAPCWLRWCSCRSTLPDQEVGSCPDIVPRALRRVCGVLTISESLV